MTKKRLTQVKGKYDKRSHRIGIDVWNLDATEALASYFKDAFKEALAIATEEYECYFWLARTYGRGDGIDHKKRHDDPGLIFVELPLGVDEDDNPRWSFSLSDMVDNAIEYVEHGDGGHIDKKDQKPLVEIRDELLRLAGVIDAAFERKDKGS